MLSSLCAILDYSQCLWVAFLLNNVNKLVARPTDFFDGSNKECPMTCRVDASACCCKFVELFFGFWRFWKIKYLLDAEGAQITLKDKRFYC